MALWRDALLIAADLLEQQVADEVRAARDTIARAAEHAATCPACTKLDPRLLAEAAAALGSPVAEPDLDVAAVRLAEELRLAVCGADGETLR